MKDTFTLNIILKYIIIIIIIIIVPKQNFSVIAHFQEHKY